MNHEHDETDSLFWQLQVGLSAAQKRRIQSLLTERRHTLFDSSDEDRSRAAQSELETLLLLAQKKAAFREHRTQSESENEKIVGFFGLIQNYGKAAVPGCPLALSLRGNPAILGMPSVAIIGSRLPTFAGRQLAWQMAHDLARAGLTIWSGGAIGIDTVALKGALAARPGDTGGTTAGAVLGSGLDNPYPPSNRPLFHDARMTLVSEFPLEQRAQPYCFPMRNFTLAWLVDYIVVIESQKNSGSLITADCAASLGKSVGAVAWPEDHPLSAGNELLIEAGADIITSAQDVLAQLKRGCGNRFSKPETEGTHKLNLLGREQIVTANEPV